MTLKSTIVGRVGLAAILLLTLPASAQDTSAPAQADIATHSAPVAAPAAAAEWRAFARSATSISLIDVHGMVRQGDEVTVKVARVGMAKPAGDYSHVIDDFAVRCDAVESHLVATTEAYEDGVLTEPYPADEPWSSIQRGTFDDAVRLIACGESLPTGDVFPTIAAYIDAGRP